MQNLTKLIQTSVSCVNIVLFMGKVWANFKVFRCPGSFKYRFHLNGKGRLSRAGFLHQVNRPIESNFRAFQNLVDEHSVEGDPASLYKLTKSDPDPLKLNKISIIIRENTTFMASISTFESLSIMRCV